MSHRRRETCRGCDGRDLESFLDLGLQPPANSLLASIDDAADEVAFPLEVFFCRSCTLVQLLDVVDPELLFGHYLYLTGTSSTMRAHFADYARAVVTDRGLDAADLVVEVASNDGSLLQSFASHRVRTLGIEPARNVAAIATARGIETLPRFFSPDVAREVRQEYGAAAAAVANNVLAHVDDTRGFLRGLAELIRPDGVVVVEAPYLGELLDRLEYDTIYHEHLSYFSITALAHLYAGSGLSLERVERVPVHGGSIRLIARRQEALAEHHPSVRREIDAERERGLARAATYHDFGRRVAANRVALRALLTELARKGHTVAAYGAPAKGNTLLNYGAIGTDLVAFTVDRNPLKVGRFTPGMHLPVLASSAILERRPDFVMILPWNIADEIIAQEAEYRQRGGRFIIPVPEPRVV